MGFKFDIAHQESYSRSALLIRSFFGFFYIMLPHAFLLLFIGLWGSILSFLSFWIILFTGSYPRNWFDYQVKALRWATRVNAITGNLVDGYPPFGLDAEFPAVEIEVPYPENLSRGKLLLKFFLGIFYVILPHGLVLLFRQIASMFYSFLAFWVVLFTGNFPANWHAFNVGTLRWGARVSIYMAYMSDEYPPFSGKE